MPFPVFQSTFVLAIAFTCCGCGGPDPGPEMIPVVPVHGSVLVKGEPATGAIVMFHKLPLDAGRFDIIRSRGVVQADGTFQLTTYNTHDGAPEGEYAVTLYWPGNRKGPPDPNDENTDLPPDKFRLKYNDPRSSKIKATVKMPESQLEAFELP